MTFSALLDGMAVRIALRDPVVTSERAFELSMHYAGDRLGFGVGADPHVPPSPSVTLAFSLAAVAVGYLAYRRMSRAGEISEGGVSSFAEKL